MARKMATDGTFAGFLLSRLGSFSRSHAKPLMVACLIAALIILSGWGPPALLPYLIGAALIALCLNLLHEYVVGAAIDILESQAQRFSQQDVDQLFDDDFPTLEEGQDKFYD